MPGLLDWESPCVHAGEDVNLLCTQQQTCLTAAASLFPQDSTALF